MKSLLGIDIGSHSIKLIEMGKSGTGFTLLAAGNIPTPPKSLASTLEADQQALANTIKRLVKETGARSGMVCLALPESQVFTRVIDVPALSTRELASAISWEAEQYIPLPLDQVNIDYTVLRDAKETGLNTMEVLLVACPKTLLDKYLTSIEMSELVTVAVETEIIATARALSRSVAMVKNAALLVSLGAQTTDLAILRNGTMAFTRSISAGGEALSRALVAGLDFNSQQAEEFKRTYGLEQDKLQGKIVSAVKPIMDTIVGEMKRAIAFYGEKYKDETVDTILLSGGTAKLPGIVVYIAENLGIEAQVANPWVGIKRDTRFNILDSEGPTFTVACGLSMRDNK
jgi:type IV pilus assembly protein PilM